MISNGQEESKPLKAWVGLLLFAALSLTLYINTLDNDFVLDDTSYIRDNYLLQDLSNLPAFFNVPQDAVVEDLSAGFMRGRNIRWVTYAFDFAIGNGSPWVFHLSNIFWHFLAGSALFLLLKKWTSSALVAYGAALIFLVHPIQTAAVAYISGRKDLLATFFLLLSLLGVQYFRDSFRWRWLLLAGLSFFLAFYSKEIAVVMIAILVWGDYCLIAKPKPLPAIANRLRSYWREYTFILSLSAFLLIRQFGLKSLWPIEVADPIAAVTAKVAEVGLSANLSFANLMLFYLDKALRPINLIADYRGGFDFSLYPQQMGWWISPVFVLLLGLFLFWLRRKNALAALGLGWFFIALLPVSHLVKFHYPAAEHYMYLPIAGFSLGLAALIDALYRRFGRPVIWGFLILLCLYGGMTIQRNRVWQNMESLTQDILVKVPNHARAQSALVHIYMESGRFEQAFAQAHKILQLRPRSAINHYNLGILYEELGEIPLAIGHYEKAISFDKRLWDAYLNLGNLLLLHDQTSRGYAALGQLTALYGYEPLAFWLIGNDLARHGDWQGAYQYYQRTLEIDGESAAGHLGLAGYYSHLGEKEQADRQLLIALEGGLNINWAAQQEPWTSFLAREEIQLMINQLRK